MKRTIMILGLILLVNSLLASYLPRTKTMTQQQFSDLYNTHSTKNNI